MKAYIDEIEYFVPANRLSNSDITAINPEWNVEKIYEKTGIENRFIADSDQTAADLGISAAQKLFDRVPGLTETVDYILLCTQSPDHFLPTSACIIQDRLGLKQSIGAIDINQGCSGFVYAVGLAKGLIETEQATNVLVITADTYSKYIHERDKSVLTLFGDAAACTLIRGRRNETDLISRPIYGTDGQGAKHLIVPDGGARNPISATSYVEKRDESNNIRTSSNLFMNGREIFTFTLTAVPRVFKQILDRENMSLDDIDVVICHQANKLIIDSIQKKMKIPEEKMHRSYAQFGNTVSSTIPIGLKHEFMNKRKGRGEHKALLLGFGVGLSWAGNIVRF